MLNLRILSLGLAALLCLTAAHGHELPENRATMVLRDETHLTLTLYVDYPDVLYRALMPEKSHREFLLASAAMSPPDFEKQIQRAQSKLQLQTRATLNGGKAAIITGWVWPDAARIQKMIQQEVMEAMVGTNAHEHTHEVPTEIRANITHDKPIKDATIAFAEAFDKMLLVSYRPTQRWVEPKQASPVIKF